MHVLVSGATGTIGRELVGALLSRGDEVLALSRSPGRARESLGEAVEVLAWPDPTAEPPPHDALARADAVVNLLGEPVSKRWSAEAKKRIRDSRVKATRHLVEAIRSLPEALRPQVLVSQSATGFYGPRGPEELDESATAGRDFLASVVLEWEAEARAAAELGIRVVLTRAGVVLSPTGGALEKMLPPFRAGVGGPVAGGHQYVPWIHLDDVVGGILFSLDREAVSGPVNLTAPAPATNRELSTALGRVLHRPAVLPVPGVALKLLYGEMSEIVLTGQRAVPRRLLQGGYGFRWPELEPALRDVLGN